VSGTCLLLGQNGFMGYYASYNWSNIPAGYYSLQAVAQNSSGLLGASAVAHVTVRVNLVENDGFETGDFGGWTLMGTPNSSGLYYNGVPAVWEPFDVEHSGSYGAFLGDIQLASLSQSVSTVPGQYYLVSLWLINPISGTNQFSVLIGTPTVQRLIWSGVLSTRRHFRGQISISACGHRDQHHPSNTG
jgi:hypothetical protein